MVMEIITKIDIQTGLKIVVKVVLTRTNLIIQKFVLTVKPLTLTMQNFVINVVYHFQRTVSNAIPHWQVVPDFAANAEQQLALNSRGLLGLNNMAISFESALGDHEKALRLRTLRASTLANNLANSDTPNFKAQDLDFRKMLDQEISNSTSLTRTNSQHLQGETEASPSDELLYRIPQQPSIDGNTVEDQVENAEYMKNALAFQASFEFLNDEFKGLQSAIRGEA